MDNTKKLVELFRRLVIKLFVEKKLINRAFAINLLSWRNSGFSLDNSVKIYGSDEKAKIALAQYIAKCPVSIKKITYDPEGGKVLFKTPKYNDYFKENFKIFTVLDFIAEVTAHIPPKHKQYIRRYGLYASRTRGVWERSRHIIKLAPLIWKEKHNQKADNNDSRFEGQECSASKSKQRSAWAGLIKKVYGEDPLICPNCGSSMDIIAIILNKAETNKILKAFGKHRACSPPLSSSTSSSGLIKKRDS